VSATATGGSTATAKGPFIVFCLERAALSFAHFSLYFGEGAPAVVLPAMEEAEEGEAAEEAAPPCEAPPRTVRVRGRAWMPEAAVGVYCVTPAPAAAEGDIKFDPSAPDGARE